MKKNYFKPIVLIGIILIIAAIATLYYFGKFNVNADNMVSEGTTEDVADRADPKDPTVIQLPQQYSQLDIQTALDNKANGSSSKSSIAKDQAITNYIRSKQDELAKSLPLQQGKAGKPAMNDLVFQVSDSTGQFITPKSRNKQTKANVADNFEFDTLLVDQTKQLIIQAYPIIQSFYGSRQNNEKIKIIYDEQLDRAYFSPWANEIHLGKTSINSEAPIHELMHAFHGYLCLNSLWEEGAAVFGTNFVQKSMNLHLDEESLIQAGYQLNYEKLPSVYDSEIWDNAYGSQTPYEFGSMVLDKVFLEDQNFFKKFNSKLYAYGKKPSGTQILRIASQSVSTIEGETSLAWFSHQYPYIQYYGMPNQSYFYSNLAEYVGQGLSWVSDPNILDGPFLFDIWTSSYSENRDFNIRFLDERGIVLADTTEFSTNVKAVNMIEKKYNIPTSKYIKYSGIVYVEITPTPDSENKRVISFLKTPYSRFEKDVFVYSKTGDIAVFSGVDGSNRTAVAKESGYFSIQADWIRQIGKNKVEVYKKKAKCTSTNLIDCLGSKVNEKNYNISNLENRVGYYIHMDDTKKCGVKTPIINPMIRSSLFDVKTTDNCGTVLSINNIPTYRSWGTSFSPLVNGLAANRSYRYRIDYALDSSKLTSKIGAFNTSKFAGFRVTKFESFGNPADDTFYQRMTFNSPYDPSSVDISLVSYYDLSTTRCTIRKVSDNSFDIIPPHLYNYASYIYNGLGDAKDLAGHNIYNLDEHWRYLRMPLNPLGAEPPKFTIGNETYNSTDSVIVKMNFASKDLLQKLSQIKLNLSQCEATAEDCSVKITSSIEGNQIIVKPTYPLQSGKQYVFTIPNVIDDNNNAISLSSWQYPKFTVN